MALRPSKDGAPSVVEMSVGNWIEAFDHPTHRGAAPSGRWSFVKSASPSLLETLRHVIGAQWEGQLYKIDGHARARLWTRGTIPAPATVRATVYFPKTEKEFFDLYAAYHATNTILTRLDEVQGAFREHGLDLKSRRLKHGLLVQAFALALRGRIKTRPDEEPVNLRRAVEVFRPELERLDKANPSAEVFQTGVVAAALIGLCLYPAGADFFHRLAAERGNKRDGLMDPVECVLSLVEKIRHQGAASADAIQEDLCARTLRAYLASIRGDPENFEARVDNTMKRFWFKRAIQAVDVDPYVARLRKAKKIADVPDL